jgi:hypothetical protein
MTKPLSFSAAVMVCVASQAFSQASLPEGVVLYAGGNLTFPSLSFAKGGDTIAGGNVTHEGNVLTVESIFAGGSFTAMPAAFQNSTGQWYFNGDINQLGGPGSVIGGSVTSATGSIDFLDSNQRIEGDVRAAGDIDWQFSFGEVTGGVAAGGVASVTANVAGGVTSNANLSLQPFVPETLPSGRGLTPSTNDITLNSFQDIDLAPGVYGDLTLASGNTVTLSAGSYVFRNIVNSFSLNELAFDTTGGAIDLYVAEDFEWNFEQVINGVRVSPFEATNLLESNRIFIEAGSDITAPSSIFGTVFAPDGNASLSTVVGRVFASGDVRLRNVATAESLLIPGDANGDGVVNSDDFNILAFNFGQPGTFESGDFNGDGFVDSDDFNILAFNFGSRDVAPLLNATLIPEPASLTLLLCGSLIAMRRRRD